MDRHALRYLRWLGATMLAAAAAVALMVLLVDPYGLYGWVDVAGFNRVKAPLARYQNEIKLARALRLRPQVVLVGNSRVEAGFDPDGPALRGANAINLGIAGTGTPTAIGQLRYLAAHGIRPRRVIAGLDVVDAMTPRPIVSARAPVLRIPWPGRWWQLDALLSAASLRDTLWTVALQRDADGAMATPRGFNPLRQYGSAARLEGYAAIFRQRAQENARKLAARSGGGLDVPAVRAEVRALLDAAAQGNPAVRVDLLVYPYHAQLLAMFEAAGLWRRFEAWKAVLREEVAAARLRHPRARIVLADFGAYGPWQCEPIPAEGSGAMTTWYWEAGHFKAALGEVLLARLDDTADRAHDATAGRAACVARQPGLFIDAARLVARAGR
ncbi:hypothetical protein [Pseudoduganella armeniaca]|uniref:Uncharacterized protein n=1 Tax=Pseudoduganella armeniaca TaxID=2072590 RepID=A0A2R4CFG2_9BURK|nr:hypothetical protein [Pseudoduganella armeniaca]AVR98387.1 hypothetical protein C9I28_24155 [Pseudoduganella armeniaca]